MGREQGKGHEFLHEATQIFDTFGLLLLAFGVGGIIGRGGQNNSSRKHNPCGTTHFLLLSSITSQTPNDPLRASNPPVHFS
jgi:hypothetical protein